MISTLQIQFRPFLDVTEISFATLVWAGGTTHCIITALPRVKCLDASQLHDRRQDAVNWQKATSALAPVAAHLLEGYMALAFRVRLGVHR